jgi:hypothetical protein
MRLALRGGHDDGNVRRFLTVGIGPVMVRVNEALGVVDFEQISTTHYTCSFVNTNDLD